MSGVKYFNPGFHSCADNYLNMIKSGTYFVKDILDEENYYNR